nr:HAD-IA family hydrolase [Shewanella cyperi]
MSRRFDLVIFDWDGTLMDSIDKIVICMQALAQELALAVPSDQAVRDIIGLSMPLAMAQLFPQFSDAERTHMMGRYREHYLVLNGTPSPLFEGVETLLASLREQGYRLAIATGKARAGLERILAETGLGHYFDTSRCADETHSKPHPQMLSEIIAELGVCAEKALMIGDSLHDLNMANNAGIAAIGVNYGAHSAEQLTRAEPLAIISSPIELLTHL